MSSTAINAQGSRFYINTGKPGDAKPTWTKVNNVKSFSGFDGSANEIDVTDLDSKAKEKQPGLMDNGAFSLDVNRNLKGAGQAAMLAAQKSQTTTDYQLVYPDGTADQFRAFVKSFPISGGVDAVMTATISLTITGEVVPVAPGNVATGGAPDDPAQSGGA
ncbi:phage tail tube protein [Burkholderia territorii]|uniref:phage tail tube protein n=1 Tax=Burkholderia territorii TaxID=1503055 RepID=UPI000AB44AC6|nr:phage tail tube protein [Burkholderia territorii]